MRCVRRDKELYEVSYGDCHIINETGTYMYVYPGNLARLSEDPPETVKREEVYELPMTKSEAKLEVCVEGKPPISRSEFSGSFVTKGNCTFAVFDDDQAEEWATAVWNRYKLVVDGRVWISTIRDVFAFKELVLERALPGVYEPTPPPSPGLDYSDIPEMAPGKYKLFHNLDEELSIRHLPVAEATAVQQLRGAANALRLGKARSARQAEEAESKLQEAARLVAEAEAKQREAETKFAVAAGKAELLEELFRGLGGAEGILAKLNGTVASVEAVKEVDSSSAGGKRKLPELVEGVKPPAEADRVSNAIALGRAKRVKAAREYESDSLGSLRGQAVKSKLAQAKAKRFTRSEDEDDDGSESD